MLKRLLNYKSKIETHSISAVYRHLYFRTNPEEFLSRMEAKSETDKPAKPKDFSLPGTAKPSVTSPVREKSLNTIMKVELLADKAPEEITQIWSEHYASKVGYSDVIDDANYHNQDAVAAVIPVETYKIMQERFKEFNTFLFPLPRDMGYEFMVVQFLGHEAHFSTLINYQAHKENAPECLSMVHYTELAEEKGIVLMVGEYDKDVIVSTVTSLLTYLVCRTLITLVFSSPNTAK